MASEFAAVCVRYFALCEGREGINRLRALALVLAELHALALRLPDTEPDDAPDAPPLDSERVYKHSGAAFPSLGFYRVYMKPQDLEDEGVIGDAVDDLRDIYLDLHKGYYLWQQGSMNNALWHWKEGWGSHWGAHLVEVQTVLFAMLRWERSEEQPD